MVDIMLRVSGLVVEGVFLVPTPIPAFHWLLMVELPSGW